MKRSISRWSRYLSILPAAAACGLLLLLGQLTATAADNETRPLAPGVMQTIEPQPQVAESYSRHDVVELLAVDPALDWSKDVPFRRDVWYLEFKFKPVRMIWVDIPQDSGKMRRELVWYMVYSVTNPGKALHPTEDNDGTYKIVSVDKPILYIPQFLLESPVVGKSYPDRVLPAALGLIRQREQQHRSYTLYNSVDMTREIPVGETAWGVATWVGVDPTIDKFSIYVGGLTNAYRWQDTPGAFEPGDPIGKGRRLAKKTLKLNFWRPGDEYYQNEKEIRYGVPGEVDYEWVYR